MVVFKIFHNVIVSVFQSEQKGYCWNLRIIIIIIKLSILLELKKTDAEAISKGFIYVDIVRKNNKLSAADNVESW